MTKLKPMIYILFCFIVLFMILLNFPKKLDKNIIYGNWAGKSDDMEIALTFNQDQTCEIIINNLSVEDSLIFKGNFENVFG